MRVKSLLRRLQGREELLTLRSNAQEVKPVSGCKGNGCEQLVCLMYGWEEMKEISENKYQMEQKDIQRSSQSLGRTKEQLKKEMKGGELISQHRDCGRTGTLQNHSAA